MASLRVGGVPEHFNLPWYRLSERDPSLLDWRPIDGGTGAMLRELQEAKLDMALMLTEGAVAAATKESALKILGIYVASPLEWGIHVHSDSSFESVDQLKDATFAISRPYSGSHLMAMVHADQRGWPMDERQFFEVGNFEGARHALAEKKADVFMWEKFTTKPLVDRGEWKRLGICETPWPCFAIVVREEVYEHQQKEIASLLEQVRSIIKSFDQNPPLEEISTRFHQKLDDIKLWYSQTRWLCEETIRRDDLEKIKAILLNLGVIQEEKSNRELCAKGCRIQPSELSDQMYNWRIKALDLALEEAGKATGPLEVNDLVSLGHLDQYHYHGVKTVTEVIKELNIQPADRVLDIGCGIGGTARVLAKDSGCSVVGVDLQADLIAKANDLNLRTRQQERISLFAADFLAFETDQVFDHFVSLLTFLHFSDRRKGLSKAAGFLRREGTFFIEDFVLERPLEKDVAQKLDHILKASSLTSKEDYHNDLKKVGLQVVSASSMTDSWKEFTKNRYESFLSEFESAKATFGELIATQRLQFYKDVAEIFESGCLGGIRWIGQKH